MTTSTVKPRVRTAYDEVPYPKRSHTDTHPRQLEATARLFGLVSPAIPTAPVLELGCAAGWNLAPIAADLRDSHCVGVDLSQRQINDGRALVADLGLTNIELRAASILDIDASWGQFDYIICHGVYSWVPAPVRDKILSVCRENLSPNGVELVSYNVFPGWQIRGMIRGMMLFHIRNLTDPRERVREARRMLELLANARPENDAYGDALRDECELLEGCSDDYLLHDHLEEHNHPVYFRQFAEHASAHGLQYLGEARLSSMISNAMPQGVRELLSGCPLLDHEQYLDFVHNRAFRQTLLCHSGVGLERTIATSVMRDLAFALATPVELTVREDDGVDVDIGGTVLTVHDEAAKATLEALAAAWPEFRSFDSLRDDIATCSSADPAPVIERVLMALLEAAKVDAYVHPPRFTARLSKNPTVTPLARRQARESNCVTTRRHTTLRLDSLGRQILQLLDGARDRERIVGHLRSMLDSGAIACTRDGAPETVSDEVLQSVVDSQLEAYRRHGLLIG